MRASYAAAVAVSGDASARAAADLEPARATGKAFGGGGERCKA